MGITMQNLHTQQHHKKNLEAPSNTTTSSVVLSVMFAMKSREKSREKSHTKFYSKWSLYIKNFFKYTLFTICSLAILPLSGCELLGLEESSVTNDPTQSGSRSDRRKKKVEVEEEVVVEFTYNPIGKRDPFRSFLAFASDNSIIDNIPRTPLQRYDIEQYTLTGIISGIDRPRALVEDPTGIGHVMELGDYIGTNWGKVTSIDGDTVTITEEYKTIEDELVTRPIKLTLRTSNNSGM